MSRQPLPLAARKVSTGFTLSPGTIDILDHVRGKNSRSAYVDSLIQKQGGLC